MVEELQKAINRQDENAVLRWGIEVYREKKATEAKMEKQMIWLESHEDHANYESRFESWVNQVRAYEQMCKTLNQAEQFVPRVKA